MSRAYTAYALTVALLAATPALAQNNSSLGNPGTNHNAATTGVNGTSTTSMVNTDNSVTSKVTADHQLRSSKLIGSTVYDEHNNSIGTVDDLLLSANERTPNVVLSVGGFLGMGNKLVEVPFNRVKINNDGHVVLPGATRDSLKAMTEYHYDNHA
jgi:sporulation protein YlmC with PRC-barrel domain